MPEPPSPHVAFYKSFGRPVAKVFLGAVFTYQAAYWLWVKLEADEIKQHKTEEMKSLEAQLRTTSGTTEPMKRND
ncbi:MAG: hypothetical protein FRX48_00761 [Lasallia pustulata]|uniref:Uncharacterized protein n=1 Tax=Lasallia pustulata TaxID=136370 RepID=A0A1W5CS36_9LECA|nr:MAG: hypothetical protein FRX48_00761 [Lasallia pustulata]SLM33469.1 hypothetical protein LPUS_01959 [Lasallia pustulata]